MFSNQEISARSREHRRSWMVFVAAALAVVVLSFALDGIAERWVLAHRHAAWVPFSAALSRWGDWYSHVAIGIGVLAVGLWRRSVTWRRAAFAMMIACAFAGISARVLKMSVGRTRPTITTAEQEWNGPDLRSNYHSFPSGHVAASAGFFGALVFFNRRLGLALLATIPVMIGVARILAGAHHVSDVVCAFALGVASAWAVVRLLAPRWKNATD